MRRAKTGISFTAKELTSSGGNPYEKRLLGTMDHTEFMLVKR
jgi:hypothetical protein